jgi:DNA-directed RNA polymerase beta' subunit
MADLLGSRVGAVDDGAFGFDRPLMHIMLVPLRLDMLRARAPSVVRSLITYDRRNHEPGPGGLFDEAIFGAGASLEPRPSKDNYPVTRDRSIRFGRIVLGEAVRHPLLPGETIVELPVLPPDLRPLLIHKGEFVMSDLNEHYRKVLVWVGRLQRLREIAAPVPLVADAVRELGSAVAALFENERLADPSRDDGGRVLVSLRGLLRPDPEHALADLDEAAGRGVSPCGPLPRGLHRTVAALFAMGLVVDAWVQA